MTEKQLAEMPISQRKRSRIRNREMYMVILTPPGGVTYWRIRAWAFRRWREIDRFIIRSMDVVASGLAMVLLSPLFATLAILVKLSSTGPVFYVSHRIGRRGKVFDFYKFRSMIQDAAKVKALLAAQNQSGEGILFKMEHDPRVTKIGRIMRKFSLDELPQLYNVFRGDMSLVGPRPPIQSEVDQYTIEQRKRLDVTPGLTCYWQIGGRSLLPFSKQVKLDKKYIAHHNFMINIVILLKTIPAVFGGKGAY